MSAGGAASRRKGMRGEQEVAALLRDFGLPADRTVQNSGVHLRGDLTGVDGYHFEVKRTEVIRVPSWLQKAHLEAGDAVPVVAFRTSKTPRYSHLTDTLHERTVTGEWHAIVPLRDLARLLSIASLRYVNREVPK